MGILEDNYRRELDSAILEYGTIQKENSDDIFVERSNLYLPEPVVRRIISNYIYDTFSAKIHADKAFEMISSNMPEFTCCAPPPKIKRESIIPEDQLMRSFDDKYQLRRK